LLGKQNVNVQVTDLLAYAKGKDYEGYLQAQRQGGTPLAIVKPANEQEIAALMLWAARRDIHLLPWGGGMSPYFKKRGSAHNFLVVDLQRMRQLLAFEPKVRRLRIQAGAYWTDLEALIAKSGLTTGQEFASEYVSVGGALATNAISLRTLAHGTLTDNVLAIRAICPTGPVELTTSVPGHADNRGFMLGSHGRWGIITEASLPVHPLPEETEVFSVNFKERTTAIEILQQILSLELPITAVYLLDGETLRLFTTPQQPRLEVLSRYTRGNKVISAQLILEGAGAPDDINRMRRKLEELLRNRRSNLTTNHQVFPPKVGIWRSRYKLWHQLWARKMIAHTLCVAVNWERLGDFLPRWEEALESVIHATSQKPGFTLTTVQATRGYALLHTLLLGHQVTGTVDAKIKQLERIEAVARETKRRWQALPKTSTLAERAFYVAGQELDPQDILLK
jgi:FAD/FMN-containing dehydrogenase